MNRFIAPIIQDW